MGSIDNVYYMGRMSVATLSYWYDGNAFEDFTFSNTIQTVMQDTLSLTLKESSTFTSTFGVKAGVPGIEASSSYSISNAYVIEGALTYTFSEISSRTVSYHLKQEVIEGKLFSLCVAAYVYRITCTKWQYDDFWWGHVEVQGSRSTFYSYLTLIPTITIQYLDGSLLS